MLHKPQPYTLSLWMRLGWLLPVACGLYMVWHFQSSCFGLPIDDAYIYVKYAGNIAQGEGYSFNPGETSFGVTSFLFTVLCAVTKKCLPWIETLLICQWMSILFHLLLLWLVQRAVYFRTDNYSMSWIAGGFMAFCRPLYFTASSGLETSLFLVVAAWLMVMGAQKKHLNLVWLGVGSALLYLSRPEGFYFTLAFIGSLFLYPLLFAPERVYAEWKQIAGRCLYFFTGLLLTALPYLLFVKIQSGRWMPMTFYGKLLNRSNFLFEPWSAKIKSGIFAITEGYQQLIAQDPMPFTLGLLIFLSFISFVFFVLDCGRKKPGPFRFAVRFAMYAFFAFPFLFGAVFRTSPMFGGYFVRYIQILIVLIHIEGAVGFHHIFTLFANLFRTDTARYRFVRAVTCLLLPCMLYSAWVVHGRLPSDKKFYQGHVSVNETVRKKAALWINENTAPDARILTSNTGLGALGAYCNRFVRDEAGLISSDIYPFLLGYSQGFNHWHKILEYMKEMEIDYYTTFPPYGSDTRHSQAVVDIEEPSLKGTPVERLMKVRINRFIAPETYDLWADYEKEAVFTDRAPNPVTEDRVRLTRWEGKPVAAVRTFSEQADIRQRMIFPSNAYFTAGIGFDSQNEFGPDDCVIVEIKVNYGGELKTLFTKTYPLQNYARQKQLDTLRADLTEFSKKYAFILYGVRASGPNASGVWTGWIEPKLLSQP